MDSEVGFCMLSFFACTSHAVSPRPGLVKLLALSNFPAYVHCDPCFTGHYGQRCLLFLILNVIGASFFLIECAIDDATPEWNFLSFLNLFD